MSHGSVPTSREADDGGASSLSVTLESSAAPSSQAPPSSKLGEQLARALPPSARTLAVVGLFLMAICGVLYLARVVFIPLTFALMLSFLLSPVVTWLERFRVPRSVGAALIVLVLLGGTGLAAAGLAAPAAEWVGRSPRVLQTLEQRVRPWRRPVKSVSELAERMERITQVDARKPPQEVTLEKPGILSTAFDKVWAVVAGGLVTLFALYFTLLTGDVLLARMIAWVPDLNQRRTAEVIVSIQKGMSRYLRTVFSINLAVGCAVALAMYVLKMPNPFFWGAIALLVIFVSLLFWGWMWGIAGAIVAVPILMLTKLMCEKSIVLQPVAALISRSGATALAAR